MDNSAGSVGENALREQMECMETPYGLRPRSRRSISGRTLAIKPTVSMVISPSASMMGRCAKNSSRAAVAKPSSLEARATAVSRPAPKTPSAPPQKAAIFCLLVWATHGTGRETHNPPRRLKIPW